MSSEKTTKQGVRDLSYIKAPPRSRRLPDPPKGQLCAHPRRFRHLLSGDTICPDCDTVWEHP